MCTDIIIQNVYFIIGLLQSLLQDLRSVEENYATIGMELELGLSQINLLESKCWLDNYSRDDFIKDLSGALKAVGEASIAEEIYTKNFIKDGENYVLYILGI